MPVDPWGGYYKSQENILAERAMQLNEDRAKSLNSLAERQEARSTSQNALDNSYRQKQADKTNAYNDATLDLNKKKFQIDAAEKEAQTAARILEGINPNDPQSWAIGRNHYLKIKPEATEQDFPSTPNLQWYNNEKAMLPKVFDEISKMKKQAEIELSTYGDKKKIDQKYPDPNSDQISIYRKKKEIDQQYPDPSKQSTPISEKDMANMPKELADDLYKITHNKDGATVIPSESDIFGLNAKANKYGLEIAGSPGKTTEYFDGVADEEPTLKLQPMSKPSVQAKQLDRNTAIQYLQKAGGDKMKARQLAVQDGYSF